MGKLMAWTKILDKGWVNVLQTAIIICLCVFLIITNSTRKRSDISIREEVRSVREQVVAINKHNLDAIGLIEEGINSTERVIEGLDTLAKENKRARDITGELGQENIEHTRRIRAVQDTTLESELNTVTIQQIINGIERKNDYNRR